ncbi:uncharacterized, partial [Tachysurus ichikawai]
LRLLLLFPFLRAVQDRASQDKTPPIRAPEMVNIIATHNATEPLGLMGDGVSTVGSPSSEVKLLTRVKMKGRS